jgi:hypothetical protein
MAVVGEREGVEVTARDPEHARVPESLHAARARLVAAADAARREAAAVRYAEFAAAAAASEVIQNIKG